MTALIGGTGIFFGLACSLALVVQAVRCARRPDGSIGREHVRLPVVGMVVAALLAMGALQYAILTDDFSVSYVADTSARATPLLFKISTAWSALEGSIVLWTLVLVGYTAVVLRQVRSTSDRLGVGALAVMGVVAVFFFGVLATVANPFEVVADPPPDGPGPNPILQNHYMVLIHPPMLYLGFVGFTVPFAFAISALVTGRGGVDWLRRTRRSNLVAWAFLSGGLVFGGWWSYEVLGWGGFWAWDPVENAALLPWLLGTAFIHSSVVQTKRGMLQAWNFVLVLATFSMTILGTFLTRSAVISSVHNFSQSAVGPAFLGFFLFVMVVGFVLFAFRGDRLASERSPESLVSREGAFIVNNVLLSLFAFVVLLGTTYPIVVEAITGSQTSVGRPYFDTMTVPLAFALLLAMGVGPFMPYRRARLTVVWRKVRIPVLAASAVAAALVVAGVWSVPVVVVAFLVAAIAFGSLRELALTAPALRPRPVWRLLRNQRGYWGGQLAHLGLAVMALSITVSGSLDERRSVDLRTGQSTTFAGYTVTYTGTERHNEPNRVTRGAVVEFRESGRLVHTAEPKLEQYANQVQSVGVPSVWTTLTRDVYVSLSSMREGSVGLTLYRYPYMWLLWLGGSVVMAGGFWALGGPRRSRRPERQQGEQVPVGTPVGTDV